MDPFIAQISMFAGTFAPRNWAFCNGQLMSISTNSALFSLLGTNFGGDGRVTFGLPDLRGRVPINSGGNSTGPGLSPYRIGQMGGLEWVTLSVLEMPSHFHAATLVGSGTANATVAASGTIKASTTNDGDASPAGDYLGTPPTTGPKAAPVYNDSHDTTMAADAVDVTGTATINLGSIPSTSWDVTVLPAGGNNSHTNVQPYLAVNFIIALFGLYPSRN